MKNKNIVRFISIIFAILSYITLISTSNLKSYDVGSLIIFIFLSTIFLKYFKFKKELKDIIFISIILSFLLVFGSLCLEFIDSRSISVFEKLLTIESVIALLGNFGLIYTTLNIFVPKLLKLTIIDNKEQKIKPIIFFIISTLVLIICWLPYFLSFFPATISPDGIGIFYKSQTHLVMMDNHTFAYAIFLRVCCIIGKFLFHSTTGMIATATFIQLFLMAIIFSTLLTFLYKRKVNNKILIAVMIYFGINPLFGYYSVVMWKDVLFSGFMVLFTISCYKMIENKDNITKKEYISFIITSFLIIFFRNNAIYMYLILTALTFIFFKKYYKKFIFIFIFIIGSYFIIKGPVFNYLDIYKSGSAEYLAMPMQQIGRMVYKNVDLTKKEKNMISKVLDVDIMKDSYNPRWSDGIKFNKNFNIKPFNNNKSAYLKLWLNLVIKHPKTATEAYAISTLGYWYPNIEDRAYENSIVENDYKIKMQPKAPKIIQSYVLMMGNRNLPIISLLVSIGLMIWLVFLSIYIIIKKKKFKYLYTYIPVLGIWITLLIASPVYNEVRYIYSLFTTLPLLLLCPYMVREKK